jgi:CheY-like chemotaxis protein
MNVLIVDDSEEVREILMSVLTEEGHDVAVAENGRQALDRLARARPDVVLLDLMMPVLSGWQVLDQLRRRNDDLPVIVLTAFAEASPSGATQTLRKPLAIEDLRAALEKSVPS